MENLEWILSLAVTALSLAVACASFLIKLVQALRDKIKAKKRGELLDAVAPIMEIAENCVKYDGADKKRYVMHGVAEYAAENGIAFDAKAVADKIEELVAFSKQVNKREK